ncbi:hypothetical protein RB614_23260 [Phytohabitans sp. ZYX-F-186]|uniref:Uncharacterized protein n=1 Tax=Phytohabitans maris TaxID=3071409 RepID=A0ABU0ZK62_9ACTN|nr:hypothetical protein [Phytohabitans sp. ZYX-F-186]MDQ7907441.1 hypothetical protein [Phytohabitans sp. ZYX-F-186]
MTIHPRLVAAAWIAASAGWLAASLAGAAALPRQPTTSSTTATRAHLDETVRGGHRH